jgi:hypothetical protein
MMTHALTLFTKGRAEFYLNGVRRGDRAPGILSSEHELVGQGGQFELRYVEPTTRVCIPKLIQRGRTLPDVTKITLERGQTCPVPPGFRALVCLGQVQVRDRLFNEEQTFAVTGSGAALTALSDSVILLDFSHA